MSNGRQMLLPTMRERIGAGALPEVLPPVVASSWIASRAKTPFTPPLLLVLPPVRRCNIGVKTGAQVARYRETVSASNPTPCRNTLTMRLSKRLLVRHPKKSLEKRMRPLRLVFLLLIMMVLACTFSLSIPIPALDLDDLTKNSDMIVSGEVLSLQEAGSTTIRVNSSEIRSHILAGRIHVARVLKGETRSPELSFQFYAPEVFVGWRSAELHTFAVFFFRARPTGNFEFTSPYHPFALAIPGRSVARSLHRRPRSNRS